ncbi:MAG TPA: ABC transporter ATP-binding protein [Acholeplasmataceae bacterium]|jgi:ATP-binding cassette subfamily B protein|nr:ABC transporter ATP-binding protein [Acholeplasmataceae bacterium]
MKIKRWQSLKLLRVVLAQALREGRAPFVLMLVLSIISSVAMYFSLRIPEIATNIAYALFTDPDLDFMQTVMPFLGAVAVIFAFKLVFLAYRLLGVRVYRDLKTKFELGLTRKLAALTWESYETHAVSMKIEMVRRSGAEAYMNLAADFIRYMTESIMYLIFYVIIISRISIWIALAFLGASAIYVVIGSYCGDKVYKTYRDTDALYKRRNYLYRTSRSKEAHQDAIANRLYWHLSKRWRMMNDEWSDATIKAETRVSVYNLIPSILYIFIAVGLLYVVVGEIKAGRQEIGYFTMIITTIMNFQWTLTGFSRMFSWYEWDFNVYKDYLDLMKTEEELPNDESSLPEKFSIRFRDVTYTYPQSEHRALNRLDLAINAGDVLAIVGVNGSGKTTFVNMLMELSKKYEGAILVNDRKTSEALGSLRNSCRCIFQDFIEYQFTIRENVALGDVRRHLTDEEIWEILHVVGMKEFVESLPNGLDTTLGQIKKGVELSKGQWQRLAVARLLANKDARIWILDEPTAYLDPLGEIEMYDFIYSLKGDRTVIFISHRLGFAKRADRIIVFKDGRVIEDGTHKSLMANPDGEYAKMYEKQKQWYE